ncbi:MAG TPA: hypothetical protein VFW50_08340 [Streptosporangiaceae bacterium]|nr:hypothetical protein [Streptosporangiaceae bacterium]
MAGGSSSSDVTQRPVSMVPPSSRSAAAMASVIRALPPATTGQPTAWASPASISPTPAVGGAVSGIMAWAEAPARIARASSVSHRRAMSDAGMIARRPKLPAANGCAGGVRSGASRAGRISSMWLASGPNRRR